MQPGPLGYSNCIVLLVVDSDELCEFCSCVFLYVHVILVEGWAP